jgi:hypothetical protein
VQTQYAITLVFICVLLRTTNPVGTWFAAAGGLRLHH